MYIGKLNCLQKKLSLHLGQKQPEGEEERVLIKMVLILPSAQANLDKLLPEYTLLTSLFLEYLF